MGIGFNNCIKIKPNDDAIHIDSGHFSADLDGIADIQITRTVVGEPDIITFLMQDGTGLAVQGFNIDFNLRAYYKQQQRLKAAEWQDAEIVEEK